jgi:hypothetical protein
MVLGVDLSTKAIDLVALDEDNPARCEHRRIELPQPWWTAASWMRNILLIQSVPEWMDDRNIYLAGIERPYGPHRQAISSLHTVLGAFLASMPSGIHAFEVSPADMRRELGLPGNCKKDALALAVMERIGQTNWGTTSPWPSDALDAWAAGHAALRINERGTPLEEAA